MTVEESRPGRVKQAIARHRTDPLCMAQGRSCFMEVVVRRRLLPDFANEAELATYAFHLGGLDLKGLPEAETKMVSGGCPPKNDLEALKVAIKAGQDVLGDAFCTLRSPEVRRPAGATYTPDAIVHSMIRWTSDQPLPARIVDLGAGSGRFSVAASRLFPKAEVLAVEIDPLACLIARANFAVNGLSARARVVTCDFRDLELPRINGPTLFIGNPPYVRHHLISGAWKDWLTKEAKSLGLHASQLAGLHVHFFLAAALKAKAGDYGVLITAAEWLDVNYGKLVRQLLMKRMGMDRMIVIEPEAMPFPGTATTAVITCFNVGAIPRTVGVRRAETIADLGSLEVGRSIRRERLEAATRWTPLTRGARKIPEGYIELGELCRVHRGAVTGANRIWIEGNIDAELPGRFLFPTVTKARELFQAGQVLNDGKKLRRVIDLPVDLDELDQSERRPVEKFLASARSLGGNTGYVANNRRAWWSVGLRDPAPILATYMARRPPTFVRNKAAARHINIAHGLYPREKLSEKVMTNLASYLSTATRLDEGRTYAGGLTKFEPREMERLLVPDPAMLESSSFGAEK